MNVSLRQLKGFLLVARLGSFTRAAEQLHITQAGLSAMMRDLETQFECRLFDRTTRSVSLTREGAAVVPAVHAAVGQLEAAKASVKLSMFAARRILTIAVTPVFASVLAPSVCKAFAALDPSVDVRIRDVPRGEIQGLVERGEADVGFGIFLKRAAGIHLTSLTRFPLVCVAPAGTLPERVARPAREGLRSMPWSALPELPLIALAADTPVQQVVDDCLAKARVSRVARPTRQVCNSMQTILALVAQGFGAAILPAMVVPACPVQSFDVARLSGPLTHLAFHQIAKTGHQLSPAVAPFVEAMVEEVNRLCASQPSR